MNVHRTKARAALVIFVASALISSPAGAAAAAPASSLDRAAHQPSVMAPVGIAERGPADPPINIRPPGIQGSFAGGYTVHATNGAWSKVPHFYTYAWIIDGQVVEGATSNSFTIRRQDEGKTIAVRVGARRDLENEGFANSRTHYIQYGSTIRIRLPKTSMPSGQESTAIVDFDANKYGAFPGTLYLAVNRVLVSSWRVRPTSNNVWTVEIPALKAGTNDLVVYFEPDDDQVRPAESPMVFLHVYNG